MAAFGEWRSVEDDFLIAVGGIGSRSAHQVAVPLRIYCVYINGSASVLLTLFFFELELIYYICFLALFKTVPSILRNSGSTK